MGFSRSCHPAECIIVESISKGEQFPLRVLGIYSMSSAEAKALKDYRDKE